MKFGFDGYELDPRTSELRFEGRSVPVPPEVVDLLAYLIRHRDHVVSREDLRQALWPGEVRTDRNLSQAIGSARRAIDEDHSLEPRIRTVRGRGYRFVASVKEIAEARRSEPGAAARESAFVGREDSLEALHISLGDALGGRGRLALIAGAPGIGKTRLAEELGEHARASGGCVLIGRCSEAGRSPAYWPWLQIVRGYLALQDPGTPPDTLAPNAAQIAQVVPELREIFPDLAVSEEDDPGEARFQLFDAITQFLARAASRQPLVLILDDLHRTDLASLRLLEFMVPALSGNRILIIGTYRERELQLDAELTTVLKRIREDDSGSWVALRGLVRKDIAKFLEATTGQAPPDGLVARLHEQTEGNPFFLTQLLELMRVEGRLASLEQADPMDLPISEGVREAVRRHLDVLSPECQKLLELASVFGREFPVSGLAKASALDSSAIIGQLREATTTDVVSAVPDLGDRYRFTHSLIRETLYTGLLPELRIRLHGQVGEALTELYAAEPSPNFAELAHHFMQTAPESGGERAVEFSIKAAERARSQLAWEESVAHYQHALEALYIGDPDEVRACEVLLGLGDAQWRAGKGQEARDTLLRAAEIARRQGRSELFAQATLGIGHWDAVDEVDHTLVKLLQEALQALPDRDSALRARVLGRLAREIRYAAPWERLRALSDEAVEMARRVDDARSVGDVLVARHLALWGPENSEDRFATAVEIVRLAEQIDAKGLALQGHQFRLADLLELGDVSGVDLEIDAISWMASDLRRPQHLWFAALFRAMRAHLNGRFHESEDFAMRARDLGELVHPRTASQWFGVQLTALQRDRGELQNLAQLLDVFISRQPWIATWRCARILGQLLGGDREAGAREFEVIAAQNFADLRRDATWLAAATYLAEISSLLEDAERARVLYGLLRPHAGRTVSIGPGIICLGSAARYLGLLATTLGRFDAAAAFFEQALEENASMSARPALARTQLDYAKMRLRRGDSERRDQESARELAGEALATSREIGMPGLANSIEALELKTQTPAPEPR